MLFWSKSARNQVLNVSMTQAAVAAITPTEACTRIKGMLVKLVKELEFAAYAPPPHGKLEELRKAAVRARTRVCIE